MQFKFPGILFYWTSSGKAEVDFVASVNERIYPLETRGGVSPKSKSRRAIMKNTDLKSCHEPLF